MPKSALSILIAFLIFPLGFVGCQSTPAPPLANIFSSASTIPPPGTNSYTFNDAPQEIPGHSTSPPSSNGVSPFAPQNPTTPSVPSNPSSNGTGTAVQPFDSNPRAEVVPKTETSQWSAVSSPSTSETSVASAGSISPGAAKTATQTGDEITIPISAFRTNTGLYSKDSEISQSEKTGTVTQTTYIAPFQNSQDAPNSAVAQPASAYADQVE